MDIFQYIHIESSCTLLVEKTVNTVSVLNRSMKKSRHMATS